MGLLQRKWFWLLFVFTTGMSIMAIEILAARLLAPHFGTSSLAWSCIIAVVLLSLSLGYFLGGKLAETDFREQYLFVLTGITGLLTFILAFAAVPILQTLERLIGYDNPALYILLGATGASALLFGLPLVILGILSPCTLALMTKRFGSVGKTSSQIFTVSTLGGLAGTFLPTLLLVPSLGSRRTLWLFSLLLLFFGLPSLRITKSSHQKLILLVTVCLAFSTVLHLSQETLPQNTIAETDSVYQHIRITEENPGVRYIRFDAGLSIQSVYDPKNIWTGQYYFDAASLAPRLLVPKPNHKRSMLLVGLAGGTITRQIQSLYKNELEITAVEIDQKVVNLATKYMGLDLNGVTLVIADGRTFLTHTPKNFDYIYVDAYQNELQIPWTMTTTEFWQIVKDHLTPGGIAAMNIATIGHADSALAEAIANTQSKIFPFVYDIKLSEQENANHLQLLSNSPLDLAQLESLAEDVPGLAWAIRKTKHAKLVSYDARKPVLTDDQTFIEWLIIKDNT